MRKNHWLAIGGGLVLLAAAIVIPRPGKSPATPVHGTAPDRAGTTPPTRSIRPERNFVKQRDPSQPENSTTAASITAALDSLGGMAEDERSEHLEKMVSAWSKEELAPAVAALFRGEFKDPNSELLGISLLRRWATLAPAVAADWVAAFPAGNARASALEQVALAWSANDPAAAWGWVDSLGPEAGRDAALLSLAYELARTEPPLALDRAVSLHESPARTQLIEHAVGNWAATDPQAALVRVMTLEDTALRNAALGHLATSWAERDPNKAATLAADAMDPGPDQNRAVAAIVQRWAQQDPDAARKWVESFPDGTMKQNALGHIAEQTAAKSSGEDTSD
jgi:hypothetical protein